jgi:hypothetical protein
MAHAREARLRGRRLCALALALALAACSRATRVLDLEGRAVDPFAGGGRVRAFVFVSLDCPISNRYAPELKRLRDVYAPRGVELRLVYPDPSVSAAAIRAHLAAYGYAPQALRDPGHALARRSSVSVTPEAAVFADGRLVYHGRIDDRFAALGRMRPAPAHRELADALDAALAGRAPAVTSAPAVGCALSEAP